MVVVERVADAERARRLDVDEAAVGADPDRMRDVDRPSPRRLLRPSGSRQQGDERLGAAVHGRDLGAVDVDLEIVDAEASRGGHQVLDRLHPGAVAADRRGVVRVDHALGRGGNPLAPDAEHDSRVRRRRRKRDVDGLSGMQSDAFQRNGLLDRVLAHPARSYATRVPDCTRSTTVDQA
jgi:hypothetical protein